MNDALLKRHLELVIEANKVTNITRISTWDEGMLLHVEDSLVGLPEVVAAPEGRYVDLGSGAGYPGIPLAVESGRRTLLVDSVGPMLKPIREGSRTSPGNSLVPSPLQRQGLCLVCPC